MRFLSTSILDLIRVHSEKSSETKAIVRQSSSTSYGKLWAQVRAISAHIQALGMPTGTVVGVMLNDLDKALSSILGIMHAGCVYCPIDTEMDATKKMQVLQASGAAHVIIDSSDPLPVGLGKIKDTLYEDIDFEMAAAEQRRFPVAYIMFTSGSTGQPKGIAISHENLLSVYQQWSAIYQLDEIRSHLQTASLSFDVSTGDWLRALCSGATLYTPQWGQDDTPERLIDFIQSSRVECAEFTPMMIRKIYNAALRQGVVLDNFKLLIVGSDTMRAREFKAIRAIVAPSCRLVFSYGTTETTIDTAYYEPSADELASMPDEAVLPIGTPFPGSELQILDEKGRRVGCGSIGELFIGGVGVGLGYITHNSRTAGRYMRTLPSRRLGRWYRTGDLASFDGTYYRLHGRADARIKIKGRFVDLAEVEGVLREHRDVLDCAATTVPDADELRLAIAIAALPGATPDSGELCDFLHERSDQRVSPDDILFVAKLPSTLSGKIDRRVLGALASESLTGGVK
ncbi:hypothetical protein DFQ28_011719 [Apophysomyces sp. BC1034]|nr:hypothetical protein DFQ28_011719 [Apophysomyces sp. BC1034]